MADVVSGGTGSVAQQMASAPRERKGTTIPFELVGFKYPPKKEAFPADDNGNVSERVALAVLRLRGSQLHFNASIYKVTSKADKVTYRAAMPSTGKNFPRPVFVTEDAATQSAYNAWQETLVTEHYVRWAKEQKAAGNAQPVQSSNRQGFELDI